MSIEREQTFEDLVPLLEKLKACEEGIGVEGRDEPQCAGESKAASENRSVESQSDEGGEFSSVLGTKTHRLEPRASFIFLHLLPILAKNPQTNAKK